MPLARMQQVIKRYGAHLALDHAELDIEEGEIVGLLGPNGAGKTTLIHILTGLIGADSGRVDWFGQRRNGVSREVKRDIGFVTQEYSFFEDLTVAENLAFFGGIYGLRGKLLQDRIQETLAFVGLTDQARKLPSKFSGGMKRRLNIACALTHRPKLLIMDEPTVGIDPQSRNHILESVRELNRQGTTILYTTHYMEEAAAIASRVVIMDQGHMIAQGTVDELVERISHEEKIRMEVAAPSDALLEKLRQLEGVKQVALDGPRLTIVSSSGSGQLDRVLSIANKEAGGVRSIQAERPTLEDVFLTLTGKQLRDGEES